MSKKLNFIPTGSNVVLEASKTTTSKSGIILSTVSDSSSMRTSKVLAVGNKVTESGIVVGALVWHMVAIAPPISINGIECLIVDQLHIPGIVENEKDLLTK